MDVCPRYHPWAIAGNSMLTAIMLSPSHVLTFSPSHLLMYSPSHVLTLSFAATLSMSITKESMGLVGV
jgi:hypothetical protein